MSRLYFLGVLLLSGFVVSGQKSPVKFGEIKKENLEMSMYPKDSSAGAVVLMDWGYVTFDHNFEVSFERHIRIKIFNSTEFDRANVEIPYYKRDRVERLKAATYNLEDGKVVEYELDRKDMFEENVSEYMKKLNFSLSNVREGSIIEYTYRVNYGGFSRIVPWYFQHEIPVKHSEYLVELPEAFEYKRVMRGYVALQDTEISKRNIMYQGTPLTLTTQHFVAKDVPAFKVEPYLTTTEDFISRISFELYAISLPGTSYNRYMPDSYGELSYALARDEDFGKRLERGGFLKKDVEQLTAGISDNLEKAKTIYNFVQEEFKLDYDWDEENYKKIYDERRGYARDINFIMIMMMKEAGIETEAVYISTRKNGLVHPTYPSSRNFNYILALATIDGKEYLLDASDKFLTFNTIGTKCLNGRGLVISETKPRWIDINPSFSNLTMTTATCKIHPDGMLEGDVQVQRKGYPAMDFRRERSDEDDDYTKEFSDGHSTWKIASHTFEGLEDKESTLVENVSMKSEAAAEILGNNIYVSPSIMGGFESNPFKSQERVYPVNYGSPVKDIMVYTFEIPEGYEVDELPESLAIALPENGGKFLYSVNALGDKITINSQFIINKVEFGTEEYPYLRAFYGQIVAKQAEQIVLKKKT
jgi:transglutaminase-like putative cysteine protease